MRKASSILFELIGLGAADFRIEPFVVVVIDQRFTGGENGGVLLFVMRHLPPKISQFRLIEKEVGESVVDFRN